MASSIGNNAKPATMSILLQKVRAHSGILLAHGCDWCVQGLATFQGGVLMVSHDQHLISSTVDELWQVEAGTVKPFHGTFEQYKQRLRSSNSSTTKM